MWLLKKKKKKIQVWFFSLRSFLCSHNRMIFSIINEGGGGEEQIHVYLLKQNKDYLSMFPVSFWPQTNRWLQRKEIWKDLGFLASSPFHNT